MPISTCHKRPVWFLKSDGSENFNMYQDFHKYQAQTSPHPLGLEVSHAKGSYIYDSAGKAHLDFVAGVSVCSLGHCHPKVVTAIQQQAERYLHVMVYGEYIQQPAVEYAKLWPLISPLV